MRLNLDGISRHESIATSTISSAESAATFARAVRHGSLTESAARAGHRQFVREWKSYLRIRVTESLVARADDIAWAFRLRGRRPKGRSPRADGGGRESFIGTLAIKSPNCRFR